jgi:hypothetical protein
MDRLSVKFGPDHDQVKFSSPETVGTECILMNMGFAQGRASLEAEVARLENNFKAMTEAKERIRQALIAQAEISDKLEAEVSRLRGVVDIVKNQSWLEKLNVIYYTFPKHTGNSVNCEKCLRCEFQKVWNQWCAWKKSEALNPPSESVDKPVGGLG